MAVLLSLLQIEAFPNYVPHLTDAFFVAMAVTIMVGLLVASVLTLIVVRCFTPSSSGFPTVGTLRNRLLLLKPDPFGSESTSRFGSDPRMRLLPRHSLALMPLILFGACVQQDREGAVLATTATTPQDDKAWAAELVEHRNEIDEDLRTSSTSPMAGTQYLKSEPGDRVYLTRRGKTFALGESALPETVLLVAREEEIWHWYAQGQEEVTCRVGDDAVLSGEALDGRAICEVGGLFLSVYASTVRVTFIVFDPERPEKRSFDHLLYFPPDRSYAVSARLIVHPEPDEIEMLTSRDLKKTFYRYAKIEFRMDGKDQELSAFKSDLRGEGSNSLFIPFRDATTSRETYGAGRFLEIEEPHEEQFVLDFNRAFNPLCNYSPAYNCAIPPRENHLEVAIKAGEMTYPH